jgi:hypothetical protein
MRNDAPLGDGKLQLQQTRARLAQFTRRLRELTEEEAFETLRLHAAGAVGIWL